MFTLHHLAMNKAYKLTNKRAISRRSVNRISTYFTHCIISLSDTQPRLTRRRLFLSVVYVYSTGLSQD